MRIYRYYKAEHGLSVLRDLEIRVSKPNSLNDPFELTPKIDPAQFTQESCEAFLREQHNIDLWYSQEAASLGLRNRLKYKRWYLRNVSKRAAKLLRDIPKNVEDQKKNFADMFTSFWRIICASETKDSILMWSHYAHNHTGMVIEFETEDPPFCHLLDGHMRSVNYSDLKAEYVYINDALKNVVNLFDVAARKAREWSYEREVRIFLPSSLDLLRGLNDLQIDASSLKNVYLGCRASKETKSAVLTCLRRSERTHVGLFQAELNPSEYALDFNAVDLPAT